MTTMVERAAINMAAQDQLIKNDGEIASWIDLACAALEAMREPSEAMCAAGESAASIGLAKPTDDEAVKRVWQAMIEAALQEQPQ